VRRACLRSVSSSEELGHSDDFVQEHFFN